MFCAKYITKINFSFPFFFLNVATRKFKMMCVSVVFLLGSAALEHEETPPL